METQNITLALPKNILRKAKILAIKRDSSLSGLLTRALIEMVEKEDAYQEARQQHLRILEQGFDLGTQGKINESRDELHER